MIGAAGLRGEDQAVGEEKRKWPGRGSVCRRLRVGEIGCVGAVWVREKGMAGEEKENDSRSGGSDGCLADGKGGGDGGRLEVYL